MTDIERIHQLEIALAKLEERIKAGEAALKLQAQEYERRLRLLNGEAARVREIQQSYVPRETYETFVHERTAALSILQDHMEENRLRAEKATDDGDDRLLLSIEVLKSEARSYVTRPEVAGAVAVVVAVAGLLTQVNL